MASRRREKDERKAAITAKHTLMVPRCTDDNPEGKVRALTRLAFASHHQTGFGTPPACRDQVMQDALEGLEGPELPEERMVIDGREEIIHNGPRMFQFVFRLFGIDRRNLHVQERWIGVIRDELERELGKAG